MLAPFLLFAVFYFFVMAIPVYEPKTTLAKGVFSLLNEVILTAPPQTNTVVDKFFIKNNSGFSIDLLFVRAGLQHEITLLSKYSLDVLDPEEVWRLEAGETITAKSSEANAASFYIEGEHETV